MCNGSMNFFWTSHRYLKHNQRYTAMGKYSPRKSYCRRWLEFSIIIKSGPFQPSDPLLLLVLKRPWSIFMILERQKSAISFIIGLVFASTIYDVWRKQFVPDAGQSSTLMKAIHCFSIVRNVHEFLKDSGGEEIGCLNGIRALTSLVTVNSHLALIGLAGLINQETVHKVN